MFITKSNFENEKINGNANKEQITKSLTDGQRTNRTNKKRSNTHFSNNIHFAA